MLVICIHGAIPDVDNEGKLLMQEKNVFLNEEYTVEREYEFEGMKLYQLEERSPFDLYDAKNFKRKIK